MEHVWARWRLVSLQNPGNVCMIHSAVAAYLNNVTARWSFSLSHAGVTLSQGCSFAIWSLKQSRQKLLQTCLSHLRTVAWNDPRYTRMTFSKTHSSVVTSYVASNHARRLLCCHLLVPNTLKSKWTSATFHVIWNNAVNEFSRIC